MKTIKEQWEEYKDIVLDGNESYEIKKAFYAGSFASIYMMHSGVDYNDLMDEQEEFFQEVVGYSDKTKYV